MTDTAKDIKRFRYEAFIPENGGHITETIGHIQSGASVTWKQKDGHSISHERVRQFLMDVFGDD